MFSILFFFGSIRGASPELLQPPGNGLPLISKDKPVDKLNGEMLSALLDGRYFLQDRHGMKIKMNPSVKSYRASYALPSTPFDIFCLLTLEQGSIQVSVGNIKFMIFPDHVEIIKDGTLVKSFESKTINGIAVERGYGLDNHLITIARVYKAEVNSGVEGDLRFPAIISVDILPNTVGHIGPWQWNRGNK